MLFFCFLDGTADIAQFSDTGRLDKETVRMIGIDQLIDRFLEIACKRAADAAAVQLGYGNTGIFHEAAVYADFTIFILQKDDFFTLHGACNQFLDQGSFTCTQESGDNIDFNHEFHSFELIGIDYILNSTLTLDIRVKSEGGIIL